MALAKLSLYSILQENLWSHMRALQHLSYAYILTLQSFEVEGLFDSANWRGDNQ